MISPVIPSEEGYGLQKRAAFHLMAITNTSILDLIIFDQAFRNSQPLNESLTLSCNKVIRVPAIEEPRRPFSSSPPFHTLSEIFNSKFKRMLPKEKDLIKVAAEFNNSSYDFIFSFRTRSALMLNELKRICTINAQRKIVDFDDIESISFHREMLSYNGTRGIEQGVIDRITSFRLKGIENNLLQTSDVVIVCSEHDKRILEKRPHRSKIHVIPNSVPSSVISGRKETNDIFEILFVGFMSYRPNEEGVLWFCKKVAPLIQEKVKVNFHISIVGFSPTKEVRNLAVASNITITGGVDSVIPYYQKADLVIAPIRYGGGTRIKIIEAMSQRLAIVSTTIGAEGLIIKHGENILIADTPEQFAEACSLLIKDSVFRNKIAMGGLECFEKKYSSLTVSKLWQEILQP